MNGPNVLPEELTLCFTASGTFLHLTETGDRTLCGARVAELSSEVWPIGCERCAKSAGLSV
jgi:hypothetical protein